MYELIIRGTCKLIRIAQYHNKIFIIFLSKLLLLAGTLHHSRAEQVKHGLVVSKRLANVFQGLQVHAVRHHVLHSCLFYFILNQLVQLMRGTSVCVFQVQAQVCLLLFIHQNRRAALVVRLVVQVRRVVLRYFFLQKHLFL